MRFAWIILAVAAIAAAAAGFRLQQTRVRSDICNLEGRRLEVRRRLWSQQLRLGELTAPQNIRRLAEDWPIDVAGPGDPRRPSRRPPRPAW